MSKERKRRFAIPANRVVDAAPLACIVIGICFMSTSYRVEPFVFGFIALVQTWLWLRFPRNLSRYLLAGGVLLILTHRHIISVAEFFNDLSRDYRREDLFNKLLFLSQLIAAGALPPMAYRLFSKTTLRFEGDGFGEEERAKSSIADMLLLSLFAAYTFPAFRYLKFGSNLEQVITVLLLSASCVACMRVFSRLRGVMVFPLFCVGSFAIGALVAVSHELIDYFKFDRYRYPRLSAEYVLGYVLLGATQVAFAVVNRYCGVTLRKSHQIETDGQQEVADTKRGRSRSWIRGFAVFVSCGLVALTLLAFFVTPIQNGSSQKLVAGWPLNYLQTDTNYEYFSAAALSVNVVAWLLLCAALLIPKFRKISWRWQWGIRGTVVLCFTAGMCYSCLIKPKYHQKKLERLGINQYKKKFVASPGEGLAALLRDYTRGRNVNFDVFAARFQQLDEAKTYEALTLPFLRDAVFVQCKFSARSLAKLKRSKRFQKLAFVDCEIDGSVADTVDGMPRLTHLGYPRSEDGNPALKKLLPYWVSADVTVHEDKPLDLPVNLVELSLRVPANISSVTVNVDGVSSLKTLRAVGNRSTMLQLNARNMPLLQSIISDIPIELLIQDCRAVTSVTANDLRKLDFQNADRIQVYSIGVANCESIRVQTSNPSVAPDVMVINGKRSPTDSNLPSQTALKLIRGLVTDGCPYQVVLMGFDIDSHIINAVVNESTSKLNLSECNIANDALDQCPASDRLVELIANNYSPSDQQLKGLLEKNPLLNTLYIDGSRLTEVTDLASTIGDLKFPTGPTQRCRRTC